MAVCLGLCRFHVTADLLMKLVGTFAGSLLVAGCHLPGVVAFSQAFTPDIAKGESGQAKQKSLEWFLI